MAYSAMRQDARIRASATLTANGYAYLCAVSVAVRFETAKFAAKRSALLVTFMHGPQSGFWDGDYPEPLGKQLTDLAHEFGEVELYVGEDGKLYMA
jgi:hypothetical protein